MMQGERQITPELSNIRLDHKNRYLFACDHLKDKNVNKIIDLACGIGYGSLMLAEATKEQVTEGRY